MIKLDLEESPDAIGQRHYRDWRVRGQKSPLRAAPRGRGRAFDRDHPASGPEGSVDHFRPVGGDAEACLAVCLARLFEDRVDEGRPSD